MSSKKKALNGQLNLIDAIEDTKVTEEQRRFIEYDGRDSVILAAVAGSGKTFSCEKRLKKLIERGVDPKRIIFFSFTRAATKVLKDRIGNDEIKITTIHAFCSHVLYKADKYKDVTNWMDFVKWYRTEFKPSRYASFEEKEEFYNNIDEMYSNADNLSSQITTFKLLKAEGKSGKLPNFFFEYQRFQKETYARDFSDMLIEVYELFKKDKWLKMFKGKYDYIFVDEFQDTSPIQLKILLSLNAKYYYLIGDKFQSIYGYSGANADQLVNMLKSRRKVQEMTLTINFRSDINIVNNANTYSELKALPYSPLPGVVDYEIKTEIQELISIVNKHKETAILVRTNSVIRQLEKELLKIKFPIRYTNFITKNDLEIIKKNKMNPILDRKVKEMLHHFNSISELVSFIKENENNSNAIETIHKSKGKEYETVVVVNSCAPEILKNNGYNLPAKEQKKVSFKYESSDRESQNIHYVAVTRPIHNLYYMLWGKI